MPRICYFGPVRAHAPGVPAFDPGEARDVSDEIAERLLKNAHFGPVEADPPAPAAPEPDEKPSRTRKAPAAPEGDS